MTMNYTCCDNTDSQLEEISELQQSKEQLISECRAKEEDINKLNSEINQLKKKLIDRDERIESMERQMDERSVEFIMPASAKANEEKLKLLEKNIEKLKEDLERANSENNILKKHKDEYQEKVNFSCFQIETSKVILQVARNIQPISSQCSFFNPLKVSKNIYFSVFSVGKKWEH